MSDRIEISISKRSIRFLICAIALGGFTYFQLIGYLIPNFREIIQLGEKRLSISDIGLVWVPVVAYYLISLFVVCTVNIFKKERRTTKVGYFGRELLKNLTKGLIAGVVVGTVLGLILMIANLVGGGSLTACITVGFVGGIIAGFLCGFGAILYWEFLYG